MGWYREFAHSTTMNRALFGKSGWRISRSRSSEPAVPRLAPSATTSALSNAERIPVSARSQPGDSVGKSTSGLGPRCVASACGVRRASPRIPSARRPTKAAPPIARGTMRWWLALCDGVIRPKTLETSTAVVVIAYSSLLDDGESVEFPLPLNNVGFAHQCCPAGASPKKITYCNNDWIEFLRYALKDSFLHPSNA